MSDLNLHADPATGIWYIKGTVKIPGRARGVRVRESSGTRNRRDAETYRDKLRAEVVAREIHGPGHSLTFAGCVVIYLEKGGEARFIGPILEKFGETRISDLTADKVSAFALEHYGHLAPASVKRFFYTPLNAAINAGCREHNMPSRSFTPPKVVRTTVEHAPDTWFPQFFSAASLRIAAAVLFLTTTGCRVSELCRLALEDCDLLGDHPRALLRRTKNGRPRMVPLTETMCTTISHIVEQEGLLPGDRVFGYSARWSVNQAIERTCARAGIKYYSTHKLGRHAFAARLLRDGGSLKDVQAAGGWASIQIVADVYGHLEHDEVHKSMIKAAATVSAEFSASPLQRSQRKTYIYVIGYDTPEGAFVCKIGVSKNPRNRLATLQVANSAPIGIMRHWRVPECLSRDIEREAHLFLKHAREAGEWFTTTRQIAGKSVAHAIKKYSSKTKGEFAIGVTYDPMQDSGELLTIGPILDENNDG